ncbi:MAG: hypothetical protein K0S97_828 [Chloroflexota bacterium]|nr:hypothetical protein [Chloroflexota bacterium]
MLRPVPILIAAIMVLAACTVGGGADGSSGAPAASPADRSGEPGAGNSDSSPAASGGGSLPASITDPIVADAATRLGVDPSAVTIVEAKTETFSDGSLGCPEPGMMYTQALVDGYQVVVEANGTQLDYRGSAPGKFRICTNP